jgi:hypothetical protein
MIFNSGDVQSRRHSVSFRDSNLKLLRAITDAPCNVSNLTLHTDLKIPFVKNEILRMAEKCINHTAKHDNKLTEELHANGPVTRRLNRTWPSLNPTNGGKKQWEL